MSDKEELEAERRELLAAYGFEESIEERFGPGTIGNHELLDRTHLVLAMWSQFVREHPSCYSDASLYRMASQIESMMADFYQTVGRRD